MSYQKENFIRIKAEYSKKYIKAQQKANERRAELYAKIPELPMLDAQLSRTGIEIMSAVMAGGNTAENLAKVRAHNEELLCRRAELLRGYGYPENYSDVQYDCPKCGDSGYVDTKMCDCMKRALVEAGYESSGLGGLIRTQSFDNFSLDYYSHTVEAKERMEASFRTLRSFAENFSNDTYKNFLLVGKTGLGKTHLSTAVAKTVIERGYDVLYVTALGMIGDFEARRFGDGSGVRNDPARYTEAELLIIDDLGTEVTNQFTVACLYDVINVRMNQRRSTIINTNVGLREFEPRYSERITSRLFGEYNPIVFEGKDIRMQKRT